MKSLSGELYNISICGGKDFCNGLAVCKNNTGYGLSPAVIFDYNRDIIVLKFVNGTKCGSGKLFVYLNLHVQRYHPFCVFLNHLFLSLTTFEMNSYGLFDVLGMSAGLHSSEVQFVCDETAGIGEPTLIWVSFNNTACSFVLWQKKTRTRSYK